MHKVYPVMILVGLLSLITTPAFAQHSGFTAGVGLGFGHQVFAPDGSDSDSENGLGGPMLKLGGFVAPNVAILFKIAGTATFPDDVSSQVDKTVSHFMGGPAVQLWATDALFLEGGIGYSQIKVTFQTNGREETIDDTGGGIMAAIGYMFVQQGPHAFGVSLEFGGGKHDGGSAYSTALLIDWQYL